MPLNRKVGLLVSCPNSVPHVRLALTTATSVLKSRSSRWRRREVGSFRGHWTTASAGLGGPRLVADDPPGPPHGLPSECVHLCVTVSLQKDTSHVGLGPPRALTSLRSPSQTLFPGEPCSRARWRGGDNFKVRLQSRALESRGQISRSPREALTPSALSPLGKDILFLRQQPVHPRDASSLTPVLPSHTAQGGGHTDTRSAPSGGS